MFYYFTLLEDSISWLRLFEYITVRTIGAAAFSFILMLLISPILIKLLEKLKYTENQTDNRLNDKEKKSKIRTPTMGGIIIIISTILLLSASKALSIKGKLNIIK